MGTSISWPGGERDDPFGREEYDAGTGPAHEHAAEPDKARAFGGGFEETGELALGDDDVRLPWLEGDDDEDYEESGGNRGLMIFLLALGVVALAVIGIVIWLAQRDKPDEQLVADGATIEAPNTPYKTRPSDPGGDVVAGTGDTSFSVAEGQTRQVQMGEDAAPAASTPSPTAVAPTPGASAAAAEPQVSGIGVQVGAYSSRDAAEKGWSRLTQQYKALSGVQHRVVEGRADIGTVYRLQAVPGDAAAADSLCASLKSAGLACQVKR